MIKKILILLLTLYMSTIFGADITIEQQAQEIYHNSQESKKVEIINKGITQINDLVNKGYDKYRADIRIASLISKKADIVWLPNEKMDLVNEGIRKFNKVYRKIKKLPDNDLYIYEFRFYRGVTFSYFPSFLKKGKIALADMEEADQISKKLKITEELELAELYSRLAYMYEQSNQKANAQRYAKKILAFKQTDKKMEGYKKQAKKIVKEK